MLIKRPGEHNSDRDAYRETVAKGTSAEVEAIGFDFVEAGVVVLLIQLRR